jgi:hypothetical protein
MQLTNLLFLAGMAAAHPSGSHAHRHIHEKRDPAFVKAVHKTITETVDATTAPTTTSVAAAVNAAVAVTSSSAAVAATASASSSSSSSYKEFCSGTSKSKRATAAEIAYKGNTGTASEYGCNQMTIDESIASLYNYTIAFTNKATSAYYVQCFNKIGTDNLIDGFFKGKGETVGFSLAGGATQYVAFESNTQGACAVAEGTSVPTTSYGEYAGSWVEFDFDNESNSGWSGLDASILVAVSEALSVFPISVVADGQTSTINSDGTGTNAFIAGTAAEDGLGANIQGGNVHATVTVG